MNFLKRFWGVALLAVALVVVAAWYFLREDHTRVLLVGFDGLDNRTLDRLIASGELPTFAKLRSEGAWGDLRSEQPLISPVLWTSIVTGRDPEAHGIYNFFEFYGDGEKMRPASSESRLAPALWNIASHYGRRVGAVNWFSSWPAERINGFVVTNEWTPQQAEKGRRGLFYPATLGETLASFAVPPRQVQDIYHRILAPPSMLDTLSEEGRAISGEFYSYMRAAETHRGMLSALQERYRPDLFMVYFTLPDTAGHFFAEYGPPPREGLPEGDMRAFARAVDNVYRYLDEVLADILELMDEHTTLIICSDHGFLSGLERPDVSSQRGRGHAAVWHRMTGVLMLYGRGVKRGFEIPFEVSLYDIVPTALALLDVPLSKELEGGPLGEVFEREAILASAAELVPSYAGVPRRLTVSATAEDVTELRKRLQALGYLTAGGEEEGEGWKEGAEHVRDLAGTYVNMGIVKAQKKKLDEARGLFKKAVEKDPSYAMAHFYVGRTEVGLGLLESALESFARAIEEDPDLVRAYLDAAKVYKRQGNFEQALALLEWAQTVDPRAPDAYRIEAFLHMELKRYDRAEAATRRALENMRVPETRAYFFNLLGLIVRGDEGRFLEAEDMFLKAAELNPGWFEPWFNLGALYDLLGRFQGAQKVLERAESLAPDNLAILNALGKVYADLGSRQEALKHFRRSLALAPGQSDIRRLVQLLEEKEGAAPDTGG
ncbi:MAG: alkaline phosphatase family protein [Acidobacteriota bacterium]|nr:MAG: alkaline phosphatase family protein [Acidobacteriota bacterium]